MIDSDLEEVRRANAAFYRAVESLDLAEMDGVWAHAEHARCVHPGWAMLQGWEAIRASWAEIFRNTVEIRFTIRDISVAGEGDIAWVACTEHIFQQAGSRVSVTTAQATNIFERGWDGWRLVHHHASHVGPPPAGEV